MVLSSLASSVSAYAASSIASLKPASTLSRLFGWGSVSGKSSPVSGLARLARTFRATTGALGEKGAQKTGESSKLAQANNETMRIILEMLENLQENGKDAFFLPFKV